MRTRTRGASVPAPTANVKKSKNLWKWKMAWMEKPRRATARRTTHSKIIIIKVGEWAGSQDGHTVRFRTVSVSTVNYKLTLQATRGQRGTAPHPHASLSLSLPLSLCLTQLCGFFVCTHTLYLCVCVCMCVCFLVMSFSRANQKRGTRQN